MNTATKVTKLQALNKMLSIGKLTDSEHATIVRMTEEDYVASLYGESGDNGLFFPANETEGLFARFWSDEHYSWDQMVDDIKDLSEAGAILSAKEEAYLDAAKALGESESAEEVIRNRLHEADAEENEGIKQSACDAVEFVALSGDALEAARAIAQSDADALSDLATEDEDAE